MSLIDFLFSGLFQNVGGTEQVKMSPWLTEERAAFVLALSLETSSKCHDWNGDFKRMYLEEFRQMV